LQNKEIKKTNEETEETSITNDGNAFVTGTVNINNIVESWLFDSGAFDHMCGKINWIRTTYYLMN